MFVWLSVGEGPELLGASLEEGMYRAPAKWSARLLSYSVFVCLTCVTRNLGSQTTGMMRGFSG